MLYFQLGLTVFVLGAMSRGIVSDVFGYVLIFGFLPLASLIPAAKLLNLAKYYLRLALLCVLVVMTTTFFPFIGGKDYFFRFAVELALIFAVLWWAFEAEGGVVMHRIRTIVKKPLFIAVSAFMLAFLLASIFANDPNAAFWSNYERGEGAFQMLHYYIFFALLVFVLDTRDEWRTFFKTAIFASVLMILYGVLAQLGWANNFINPLQGSELPEGWWAKLTAPRFQGSLGNPAYVAPYLAFSIFYALYLLATSKSLRSWATWILYGGLSLFFLFFFIMSKTRGAFIGLAVSILVFLICLGVQVKRWRIATAVIFAVLVAGGVLGIRYSHTPFIQSIPGGRLLELSFSGDSAQTRLWTWGSAWQGFKERPITGWGPENFSAVFDKYFDPRHYSPGKNTETWFDRAHSIYFDYLTETGVLGLASYLSIFAVILWGFVKLLRHGGHSAAEVALLVAVPVGYLAQGIAIFDVLPMYINLFVVFAFSYFVLYGPNFHERHAERHHVEHHRGGTH